MSKLSAFLLVLALTISAFAPANIGASSGVNAPANSSEPFCGDTTTVDLLRNGNKKLVSGTVTVANGETTLFVTYTPASPWTLVQTDLAVAASLADIPVTNKGNPKVDQFPYRSSHAGVTTYTYEIPLGDLGVGPGDSLVVAAHADLRKTGSTKTEGAWSDGTDFVPGKRSWGMYFTYSVQPCNQPPVAVNDTATVAEDSGATMIDVLANDFDPDNDPFTIASASDPANGTVVVAGDGLSLTYQPDANYCNDSSPTDDFTYSLDPGGATATVAVTVNCVDDAPVAVNDSATVAENAPATTINVLANDTDVEGNPFSIVSVTQPANGTVVNNGTDLTYEPDAAYCNDGSPTDDFTYTLTPGGSTATVAVTVTCFDDAPTAVNDAASVTENSGPNTINVLANDTDPDGGPISISSVTQPVNGTVVITNGGADLTYEPDAVYCNDGTPTDDFTYTLTPGSSTATVAVTVTCVDEAPVAVDDTATVLEDSGATAIDVLANDTDADGGPISVASVTQPANGTVIITGGGTGVTYQPDANYCNDGTPTDDFTYTLSPGGSTATVSVTVTCVDDPPTAFDDTATVAEDSSATTIDVLANDADLDGGGAFSIASVTQPTNGTVVITNSGADLTYQPNANYCNGGSPTDDFTYTLTPGGSTATVAVTVTCVNDAPVNTVPGAQSVNEDTDLTFSAANGNPLGVTDADAGSGNIQVTVSALNGTITPDSGASVTGSGTSTAVITGTLAQVNNALDGLKYKGNLNFNDTRGSETLTILTNDQGNTGSGGALTDTDTVNITVNAVNDAPTALAKNFNAQANMKITGLTGLLTGATDPDTGDSGYTATFTVGTVSATTPAGGTITNLNTATGSFDFDPPPGATGNVTFTYTVCDSGNPAPSACSAPATVTVSVAGPVIWFVNPAAGVNGDGRLSTPFNSLASAAAVDATGHRIFVYTGTATSGITLHSDEWLIGQGVTGTTFDALFPITPPAGTIARPSINGTRPVIQGNVAMATSDVVRGLNIQPASGTAGLTASGATSLTVNEVTVITSNAVAVSLLNSDGTFSFTRIDAIGGSNGIVWSNASPATGSFTVIGDGTNTSVGGNGTGGIIANMSGSDGTTNGIGIYLNNARNVTLRRMHINGTNQNYGIRGNLVNGFALEYSIVGGTNGTASSLPAPNNAGEGSVYFGDASTTGLTGSATFTNVQISGGRARNFSLINNSGTLDRLTITGSTFGLNQNFVDASDSLSLEARNGGTVLKVTVTGSTFLGAPGDLAEFVGQQLTTMDVVFQNNTLLNSHAQNIIGGGGLTLATAGTMTFNVTGNSMRGADGSAVTLFKASALSGTPSMSGVFSSNTIGVNGVAGSGSKTGNGIFVSAGGTGTMSYTITNNTILQYLGNAAIYADNTGGSYTANFTITGNTAAQPGGGAFAGLAITNGSPSSSDTINVCADIKTNDFSAGDPANANDIIVGASGAGAGHTFNLPGYAGGANLANVQSFIQNNNLNPGTTAVTAYTDAPVTAAAFTGVGTTCSTP